MDVEPTVQAVLFTLRGDLDFSSAVQFQEAADAALAGLGPEQPPPLVVIDCSALEHCDSSGINGLIKIYQRLAAYGGTLRLASVPGSVVHVFELTSLDELIGIHPTVAEALVAAEGRRGEHSGSS